MGRYHFGQIVVYVSGHGGGVFRLKQFHSRERKGEYLHVQSRLIHHFQSAVAQIVDPVLVGSVGVHDAEAVGRPPVFFDFTAVYGDGFTPGVGFSGSKIVEIARCVKVFFNGNYFHCGFPSWFGLF